MTLRRGVPALLGLAAVAWSGCRSNVPAPPAGGGRGAEVISTTTPLTFTPRTGWTGTSVQWPGDAWKAFDDNLSTKWSTEVNATSGMYFQVDMLRPQTFAELTLDAGNATNDYPRGFQVKVSNNGTSWTSVTTATGTSALVTVTFPVQTARYLQIVLTAGFSSWWSIGELKVIGPTISRAGWTATGSANASGDTPANALDGTASTRWSTTADQAPGQFFTLDMQTAQNFNQVTLDAGTTTGKYPRGYEVYVSNDGSTWGSAVATGTGTTEFISITFPFQWARYVKVVQTETSAGNVWAIHELNVLGQPTALTVLSQAAWTATVSPTGQGTPSNAFDGNVGGNTRWTTGAAQANGQYFRLDMGAPRTFSQLTLDANPSATEFPGAYQVHVSNDGTTWGSPVATGTGSTALVTIGFPAQTARYIKVTQTGTSSPWWSLYELNVYHTALSRAGWLVTASANSGSDGPSRALDNTTTTRWNTSGNQTNGQFFQLDMVTPHVFNELSLDAGFGSSANNYPRGYDVKVSNDGTNWGSAIATGAGTLGLTTIKFLTQTARYIKITQTGSAGVPWSIYELGVWRGLQSCDAGCTASDTCHDVGTCDPYTSTCSNPAKANGASCSDGNGCTVSDTCTAGVCTAGTPVTCTAQDQCHVAGTCDTATGVCSNPAKNDGVACTDGNACTQTDTCQAGTCTGANPVVCTADQCHDPGTCNTGTGVCSAPTDKTNGTTCSDDNACTQADTCVSGTCTPGTATAVDDGNPCTTDACDPVAGVTHTNPTVFTYCEDGDLCTSGDYCSGSTCVSGTPVMCITTDQCHAAGTCSPQTGQCSTPAAVADTTPCNDGNACTQTDTCVSGVCTGASPLTCQAGSVCELAACDPDAGPKYPANDLVSLWHFDKDAANPWYPGSGSRLTYDATDTGAYLGVTGASLVPGHHGSAYSFTAGSCLRAGMGPSVDVRSGTGLTMAAWVKPTGTCAGSWKLFWLGSQAYVDLSCTGSGAPGVAADVDTGSGLVNSTAFGSVPQGQWSFVAMTWDGQTVRIYVNGQQVGSFAKTGQLVPIGWRGHVQVGCNPWGSFAGSIDEAALYMRALSAGEIAALAAPTNACKTTPKCSDPGACQTGVCNPATGACSSTPKANGTSCSDGQACTEGDVCAAGVCTGGGPTACAASQLCNEAACDTDHDVLAPSEIVGQWHLDGDFVDASGHGNDLTGGQSTVQLVPGKFGQAVHAGFSTASCLYVPGSPRTAINSSNGFTFSAWVKPDAGNCPGPAESSSHALITRTGSAGLYLNCKADNTLGLTMVQSYGYVSGFNATPLGALPAGEWSHVVMTYAWPLKKLYLNGALLHQDLTTSPEGFPLYLDADNADFQVGCGAGSSIDEPLFLRRALSAVEVTSLYGAPVLCAEHPKTCAPTDACHLAGTCSPTTGVCSTPVGPDGVSCNDSNACTANDTCQAGACSGTNAVTCTASDQCHAAGTCNPASGVCSNPAKVDGTTCNDAESCSSGDVCTTGVCLGATFDESCTGPNGYLHPQFFQPKAGYTETDLFDINNAGTAVGYSSAVYAPRAGGQAAEPYVVARGGNPTQLANPWPNGGQAYAFSINEQGYVGGFGGPNNTVYNTDFRRTVLYHPDRSFELPTVPQVSTFAVTNAYGPTTGLPNLVGATHDYAAGAIGAWHLDGNTQDVVGYTSLPSPGTGSFIEGRYGQAVAFDGATCVQAASTAATAVDGAAGLTMMAWVKPDPAVCTGGPKIVVQRGWDYTLAITCNAAGQAALTHYLYMNEPGFSTPVGALPFGQWSHVAVSWDKRQIRSYVNGAVTAVQPLVSSGVWPSGNWLSIGCYPQMSAQNFKGAIDEVALFRHPMGADQIARYMNNRGDYRPAGPLSVGVMWQWSRYIDGFVDRIAPPSGAMYQPYSNVIARGADGSLVGLQYLTNGSSTGVIYTGADGVVNANDLLPIGSDWDIEQVSGVNAGGLAIGEGLYNGNHAIFRMDLASHEIVNLGPYPEAPFNAPIYYLHANDINAAGHVVGTVYDGTYTVPVRAFVHFDDQIGMVDLNDFINPASGWTLDGATAINDSDEIVGFGHHSSAPSTRRAFRLKLPATQQAACAGKAEGAACDDGNVCTQSTTCQSGSCVGTAVAVDDQNPCTADACTASGVAHTPVTNGSACNDGNACTQTDACLAGVCVGSNPVVCATSDSCHTGGGCNPSTGSCSALVTRPEGASCNDGDPCSAGEVCHSGVCRDGTAVSLTCAPPSSSCKQVGTCDATAFPEPISDGLVGWWRFEGDTRDASGHGFDLTRTGGTFGVGKVGSAVELDGNACLEIPATEAFDMTGTSGVTMMAWVKTSPAWVCPSPPHPRAVMGRGFDYSLVSACWGGPLPGITEAFRTTSGTHDLFPGYWGTQPTDSWTLVAVTYDHHTIQRYLNGAPGDQRILDGVPSRADPSFTVGCMKLNGHPEVFYPYMGSIDEAVLYNRVLTPAEISSYFQRANGSACKYENVPENTTCDDGNACTTGEKCQSGTCGGGVAMSCPQPGPCVVSGGGTCDPLGGCPIFVAAPNGTACNDGNACTQADSCQAGLCQGANPIVCAGAQNGCGSGVCNPTNGQCEMAPGAGAACQLGVFDYDGAGRLIRDHGTKLTYDAYDQLRKVEPGAPLLVNLPVTDVGQQNGSTFSAGYDINNDGQIAGTLFSAAGEYHGISFSGAGPLVNIDDITGVLQGTVARGINEAGTMTGPAFFNNVSHMFRFRLPNTFEDLGSYNGDLADARAINIHGDVVGVCRVAGILHACRYVDGAGYELIGDLGGNLSDAEDIDDLGRIVGRARLASSPTNPLDFASNGHAFIYDDTLQIRDLNTLVDEVGSPGWVLVWAQKIRGDYVYGTGLHNGAVRPFRLTLSSGAVLEAGVVADTDTTGHAGTTRGDMVGCNNRANASQPRKGWVYIEGVGFKILDDLIAPTSGWTLECALAISESGDITGYGTHDGVRSGFRLRLPLHTNGAAGPMLAETHTYGYDGLRTSTTTYTGGPTPTTKTQYWFTQDYTETEKGHREHYIRIGDRIVAKVTMKPVSGVGFVAPVRLGKTEEKKSGGSSGPPMGLAALLLALGLLGGVVGFLTRRRGWVPATAALLALIMTVTSCEMFGVRDKVSAALWEPTSGDVEGTRYFHNGLAPGPTLITNASGGVFEERRYEPFGHPIDAKKATGGLGGVNFAAEPQNILGKMTNPNTGWSYHGARWMAPQTARWSAPDPAIKGPDPKHLLAPWDLNPYAYVNQNPSLLWDPDGWQPRGARGARTGRGESGFVMYEFPELIERPERNERHREETYRYNTGPGANAPTPLSPNQPQPIRVGEVTTYNEFNDRSPRGDEIEGHDVWQIGWRKANGRPAGRGGNTTVVALPRAIHAQITQMQRSAGLHDPNVLARQTAIENISINIEFLRRAKVEPSVIREAQFRTVLEGVLAGNVTPEQAEQYLRSQPESGPYVRPSPSQEPPQARTRPGSNEW